MKEESASLMMTTEPIFITSVIDAKENRKGSSDEPTCHLFKCRNDQDVIMFMRGRLAELMTMIAPQTYQKHVTIGKRTKRAIFQHSKRII